MQRFLWSVLGAGFMSGLWACDVEQAPPPSGQASDDHADSLPGDMGTDIMSDMAPITVSCRFKPSTDIGIVCEEYTGTQDVMGPASTACDERPEGELVNEGCTRTQATIECSAPAQDGGLIATVWMGTNEAACSMAVDWCASTSGTLLGASTCEDGTDGRDAPQSEPLPGVFQPFEYLCQPPVDVQPNAPDEICTWQAIGGCTAPGQKFWDYAACEPVLTQRPYYPVPPASFKTPDDDPVHQDEGFLEELAWVKSQAEACGCVCCHTESQTPNGASLWDSEAPGIWTDSFTDHGLATAAGWVDSSALGAFDSADNHGFGRTKTGLPTTDVTRMIAFFEGELKRRGLDREDFADATPIGGPLYQQMVYEPDACDQQEGVKTDGAVVWKGGAARYIYVLEAGSKTPTVPPNLDTPDGTIWRLNVDPSMAGQESGLPYGSTPTGTRQVVPASGAPARLEPGTTYYLVTMLDIAVPLTRCLFVYGDDSSADSVNMIRSASPGTESETVSRDAESNWNRRCQTSDECDGAADFCARQPGSEAGYCTINCNANAVCREANAPSGWTCNALACDIEGFTWCGPAAEIADSGGFLKVCE
ncbi:MAG: proteinase inhibitor [Myxococcota bacterium]|nr:proteinase inhibitor [Myxococcota bacterium]